MNTDRIYQGENDAWYFNVRGDRAMGPYATYHEANRALSDHVAHYTAKLDGRLRIPRFFSPGRLMRRSAPRHT